MRVFGRLPVTAIHSDERLFAGPWPSGVAGVDDYAQAAVGRPVPTNCSRQVSLKGRAHERFTDSPRWSSCRGIRPRRARVCSTLRRRIPRGIDCLSPPSEANGLYRTISGFACAATSESDGVVRSAGRRPVDPLSKICAVFTQHALAMLATFAMPALPAEGATTRRPDDRYHAVHRQPSVDRQSRKQSASPAVVGRTECRRRRPKHLVLFTGRQPPQLVPNTSLYSVKPWPVSRGVSAERRRDSHARRVRV